MVSKIYGDIGELEFITKCRRLGYAVLSPYSSISVFDFVIYSKESFKKIQVKTTFTLDKRNSAYGFDCYKFICSHGRDAKKMYKDNEVDYFVLYIEPVDIFYIIPFEEIVSKNVRVYPDKIGHKFNKYIERFDLLNI